MTPECALTGYPGAHRDTLDNINTCRLADAEDRLLMLAERAELGLVLGSVGKHPQDHAQWANEAVIGGAMTNPTLP